MTIASEIQRIQTNIANAYDALEAKGATMPATENTDNLVTTIDTISGGGGETVTATNNTGSAITAGDKVWINENNGSYMLERYSSGNNFQNLSLVGSMNIDTKTGIASGFSSSNYLRLSYPFNPGSDTWEIVFKVTTGSSFSNKPTIFGNYGAWNQNAPQISITPDTYHFNWIVPYGSGSSSFDGIGSYTVQPNTTYWLKLSFTGSQYKLDYSTDGQTFITDSSYSTSDVIKPATEGFNIGFNYWGTGSTEYWTGSIDLSESYINVNGEITNLIQTTNQYVLTSCSKNNSSYDDSFIDEKCVFFPSIVSPQYSHYQLDKKFNMGSNPWSLHTKIKSPMDSYMNSTNVLFSGNDDFYNAGFSIELSNNTHYLGFGVSTDNSSWNIGFQYGSTVIQPNTWYWIIVEFTGTKYLLKLSTDGVNYTDEITFTSSSYINPYSFLVFGHRDNDRYWRGNIDFSETYIDINGSRWVSCAMIVNNINQNSLTGFAQENIASGSTGQVETLLPHE